MPITIVAPSNQTKFDIVDGIVSAVGRQVTLQYVDHVGPCLVCSGFDPFCVTCSGYGTIEYNGQQQIIAAVRWGPSEKKIYTPNGQYVEGDCKVVFTTEDTNATDLLLQKTKKVIVDSRSCVIDKWYYKGGPLNRVYLILQEDEPLNGHRIG